MMGHRQVEQAALFCEFSLEKHIPADHLLRSIDRFVDLEEVPRGLAPFYSSIGRPSIDPKLMIRMLLIGYCFGIRSERACAMRSTSILCSCLCSLWSTHGTVRALMKSLSSEKMPATRRVGMLHLSKLFCLQLAKQSACFFERSFGALNHLSFPFLPVEATPREHGAFALDDRAIGVLHQFMRPAVAGSD
jgi:hypothetical protein